MPETNQTPLPEGQEPKKAQKQEELQQQPINSLSPEDDEDDIDFSGRLSQVGRANPSCKPISTDKLFEGENRPTVDQLPQLLSELRAQRGHSPRPVQTDN